MTALEEHFKDVSEREEFRLRVYDELEGYGIHRRVLTQTRVRKKQERPFKTSIKETYLFPAFGAILGGIIGIGLGGGWAGVVGIIIGWFAGVALTQLPELLKTWTKSRKRMKSKKIAQKLIKKKEIQQLLCPALQSVSTDVWEIAKIATPILYASAVTGTVSIPRDPVVFAALAIVVARMGIASLCDDNDKK